MRFKRWSVFLWWLSISAIIAFLLSRFVFFSWEKEKNVLGQIQDIHLQFNWTLFLAILLFSLLLYGSILFFNRAQARTRLKHITFDFFYRYKNTFIISLNTLAGILLLMGYISPLYHSEKFYLIHKDVSLIETIQLLFDYQEFYLGILLVLFTFVFPVAKFITIYLAPILKSHNKIIKVSAELNKWSMLDVFVVSLILINFKFAGGLVQIQIQSGLIFFSLSIILMALNFYLIRKNFNIPNHPTLNSAI